MVIRNVATEVWCPRYGNRGMVSEVLNLGERTVGTEVSYLGRTGLTNIVRIRSSLCRGRSISPYPGWTQSGSPGYPGIARPGYRSQRFSLSLPSATGLGQIARYLYGVSSVPTYDLRSEWLQESTDRTWLRLSCRGHCTRPGPAGDARRGWLVPRYSVQCASRTSV